MYKVMPIGGEFKGKGHEDLARKLSDQEKDGWELVEVFPVVVSGCFGFMKEQTNYAVLRRIDNADR